VVARAEVRRLELEGDRVRYVMAGDVVAARESAM
jgi:hypothetical protein